MLAEGRPNGSASSDERLDDGGTYLAFSAEVGTSDATRGVVGEVFLDGALAWRAFDLEVDGRSRSVGREEGHELEIEGVPALHGVTIRRLIAAGLAPGERRDLDVERRLKVRYTWAGGPRFRYEVPGDHEASWLLVRPATGVVVSVEDTAELRT
jgi:hypothetical protein